MSGVAAGRWSQSQADLSVGIKSFLGHGVGKHIALVEINFAPVIETTEALHCQGWV